MSDIIFDKDLFWDHIKLLIVNIKKSNTIDNFLLITNDKTDENIYAKSLALQHWLFGYELTGIVLAIVKNVVYIIASQKKITLLQQLDNKHNGMELKLLLLNKEDKNIANITELKSHLINNGTRVGLCTYKNISGDLANSFMEIYNKSDFKTVDFQIGLADTWACKDEKEIKCHRKAAELSTDIFKLAVDKVEAIIDQDTPITHSAFSTEIDNMFANPAQFKLKCKAENLESCYVPIVMSGGVYDLKASASSDDNKLHQGCIIIELGARYKYYCSNIARTLLINPTQVQEENYKILLKVYQTCINTLKNGVTLNEVWNAACETIKKEKAELLPHFTRNCGFSTGLEFREPALVINEKATAKARSNMIFNICIGFSDLTQDSTDPKNAIYSLLLADTVIISDEPCERLTHFHRDFSEVSYRLGDEEEEKDDVKDENGMVVDEASLDPAAFIRNTRSQNENIKEKMKEQQEAEKRRREHQIELYQQKQKDAYKACQDGICEELHMPKGSGRESNVARDITSYTSTQHFPPELRMHQIFVDVKNETALFPIQGRMVPFHVDTIKSANTAEEGLFTYLRVNFENPQQIYGKNVSIDEFCPPECIIIRELTYRAKDPKNLLHVSRIIKELKKTLSTRRKENEEKASLVDQQQLVVGKTGAYARLRDVTVRPVLAGRKNIGILECHQNGFRFIASKGNVKGDIIFANIKHAFFQPADDRSIAVLVHFHLITEILWGKKKTKDVQFYVDVVENSQDLSSVRNKHDADGIQEEQEERMLRQKTNERFKEFCRKVEEATPEFKTHVNQFDIPFRDLMFVGVPGKSNVDIMPSVFCITALEDQPPFVLTLADIEIAHFERVQGSLKNFDVVFVFKDYTRPVQRITAVPREHFETLKEFLDSSDILYFTGTLNLDWTTIMPHVLSDLDDFYESGGWNFLDMNNEHANPLEGADAKDHAIQLEDEAGSEDESEEESEFEEDSDSDSEESSESDFSDSDASGSDDDSDASGDEDGDSDDEDDASDWDELERRAAAEDKAHAYDESDDSDNNKKKKRPHGQVGSSSKGAPPPKKPMAAPSRPSGSSNFPNRPMGNKPGGPVPVRPPMKK